MCDDLAVDLGDFLRLLFYLWLASSLTVFGVRVYRKITKHGQNEPDPATDAPGNLLTDPEARGPKEVVSKPAPKPAEPSLSRAERKRAAQAEQDVPSGSLVQAAIREELAKQRTDGDAADPGETDGADAEAGGGDADTGSARTGLFASRDASADRSTVATALEGIAMPCGLVPLLDGDSIDPYRVSFVTTGAVPATVATEVADELERLGFTIRTIGASSARATRGATKVDLEVVEDAASARVDGQRRFPHVAGGAVVVVFST